MEQQKGHFKAWLTKYALTKGIIEVDAELCIDEKLIKYGKHFCDYAYGNDWHRTPESAIEKAEKMRQRKIVALKKKLTELETMPIGWIRE